MQEGGSYRRRLSVPYLSARQIEFRAQRLLNEWAERDSSASGPPVPIEEILELHLGLRLEITDLQCELGQRGVLGGIFFDERVVKVDKSLDPVENCRTLGRYRFTLAHEMGHWCLHRNLKLDRRNQEVLLGDDLEPAWGQGLRKNAPEEIQANMFASCVLMPRQLVFDAWDHWLSSANPIFRPLRMMRRSSKGRLAVPMNEAERCTKPFARMFNVSNEAMRYRLLHLGLVFRGKMPLDR